MRISDWSSDVCSSDLFFLRGAKAERGSMVRPPPPSSPPSARGHASALRAWLRRRGGGHWLLPAPWREGRRGCHSRDGARHSRDGASHIPIRSEEHTSELQSLMRISYAVFCLKKKKQNKQ